MLHTQGTHTTHTAHTPHTQAVALGKPWVFDPVGCGATPYRTAMCAALLACKPTVVRGNGSEILALAGAAGEPPSVKAHESAIDSLQLQECMLTLCSDQRA